MSKILLNAEARNANLEGAKILYDTVRQTYGPVSGNVGILRKHSLPIVTHDGVTVAKGVEVTGDAQIGADLIKQAAVKMDDRLGDGTTTVTILAYHILEEALARSMLGENTMVLRRQLEKDMAEVLSHLPNLSEKHETEEQIKQIATVSAGDEDIGSLVASVVHEIGKDGVVTVEETQGLETTASLTEGYTFDKGYASPYMVADPAKMETILNNPYIYVTDKKITKTEEVTKILEKLQGKKELLVIAEDIKGDALAGLVLARTRVGLNVVAVQAPFYADNRKEVIKDIASLVGCEISDEVNYGSAEKVVIGRDQTTIVNGQGDISDRLSQIATLVESEDSEYGKQQLKKRMSDLQGKVAVIKVGGASEAEIDEKKFRIDDAVYASKAALEEGTVVGGAVTYYNLGKALPEDSILGKALKKPIEILLSNAMIDFKEVESKITKNIGVDVLTGEVTDLRKVGIIDPTKTIREAIINSVSVAGVSMTMQALVIEEEEYDD